MKFAMRLTFSVCLLLAAVAAGAASAAAKSAVVLPFVVNAPQSYAYLSKAVPATIQGQLDRPGMLETRTGQSKASSQTEAQQALRSSGADNAVWGSVSVMGNDCTVIINSVDKAGKTWTKTGQAPVSELTTTVQSLTSSLSKEVFGVSTAMRSPGSTAANANRGATSNADIVTNEAGQQQVYLNPQFRYQGAGSEDGSRLRTQRLPYNMVDMAVGDFNGDGKNEVAILSDHDLRIYSWPTNGQLKLLAETVVSRSNNNFSMRAIDLNRDRCMALAVATTEESSNRPYSYIYSFKGNKLTSVAERIPYYVSVMRVPPT